MAARYEEDAAEAMDAVRRHFTTMQSVFSFEIEKAELKSAELVELPEKKGRKYWDIRCSFFPSVLADKRAAYSVLVDAKTNKIYRVAKEA